MKLPYSLIFLISIVSSGYKYYINSDNCYTRLDCKAAETLENPEIIKKVEECEAIEIRDDDDCMTKAIGFSPKQVEILKNKPSPFIECRFIDKIKVKSCFESCRSNNNGDCIKICADDYQTELGNCLAKLANKPNFDVKKSIECANSCNQGTLPEVFDCDYNCKKEVYEAFSAQKSSPEKDKKSNDSIDIKGKANRSNDWSDEKPTEANSDNKDTKPANSTDTKQEGNTTTSKDPKTSSPSQSVHSGTIFGFKSNPLVTVAVPFLLFSLIL